MSGHVTCRVQEYQPDATIRPARYDFAGSASGGWEVHRDGQPHLRVGPGYRLLQVSHCGICSTDLARHHLPFPLPQVTGHEVVARDDDGGIVVVEINASHVARGLDHATWCAHCRAGMPSHCPDRLVLGIHDLPGGFSPYVLAPVGAIVPVPAALSPATTTLVEPFAAALAAVRSLSPAAGERVLVLGPGRLGSLVVAALAAWRRRTGVGFEIVAAGRRPEALARARSLGADDAVALDRSPSADVVVETTGSVDGLDVALRLARREVHVKSTTGQPTFGLRHLTELVVDEMALQPWAPGAPVPGPAATAVLAPEVPGSLRRALESAGVRVVSPAEARALPLGGADLGVAVVTAGVDALVRPDAGVERGVVRARGTILLVDGSGAGDLVATLRRRGVRLGTTRCGDFASALALMVDPSLAHRLGELMVTAVVPAERLADGFAIAARGGKVVVTHPGSLV